jgi:hypothetical protein
MPAELRSTVRTAERELRSIRWLYLHLSVAFQLELAGAQIVLQRLGQQIEWLTSVVVLCHHAAVQDETQWRIARLQSLLLLERARAVKATLRPSALRKLRKAIAAVGIDIVEDRTSLFTDLPAEPYQHPFR